MAIYNIDKTDFIGNVITATGEYVVTGVNTRFKDSTADWTFGNLTDTSKVTNMCNMFQNTSSFSSSLTSWDVMNVTNMSWMFYNSVFNGDVSTWNISNVEDFFNAFASSQFNNNIANWNTSNVVNMGGMFSVKWTLDVLSRYGFSKEALATQLQTSEPSFG